MSIPRREYALNDSIFPDFSHLLFVAGAMVGFIKWTRLTCCRYEKESFDENFDAQGLLFQQP